VCASSSSLKALRAITCAGNVPFAFLAHRGKCFGQSPAPLSVEASQLVAEDAPGRHPRRCSLQRNASMLWTSCFILGLIGAILTLSIARRTGHKATDE
jgi:hypothetical protein